MSRDREPRPGVTTAEETSEFDQDGGPSVSETRRSPALVTGAERGPGEKSPSTTADDDVAEDPDDLTEEDDEDDDEEDDEDEDLEDDVDGEE